ncbi:MAG TPA: isoprenylcysteine carboxylmethyltransferase family protein [bacterium]
MLTALFDRLKDRRLALGWVFAAAFLVEARPTPGAIAGGAVLFALGAAVRTWAAGHIRKREALAVTGPYAHTRNPLYFGSFLMACGALVMGRAVWVALAFLLIAVPVYHRLITSEEVLLTRIFGEAYAAWAREVPRFFPRLRVPPESRGSFDWGLVLRQHREWQAWVGGVALMLLLLARWHWFPGR